MKQVLFIKSGKKMKFFQWNCDGSTHKINHWNRPCTCVCVWMCVFVCVCVCVYVSVCVCVEGMVYKEITGRKKKYNAWKWEWKKYLSVERDGVL